MVSVWNDVTEYQPGDLVLVAFVAPPPPELAQNGAAFYIAKETNTNEPPAGSPMWAGQGCLVAVGVQ